MLEKVYVVRIDRYDYFGGQKDETHSFTKLMDAFAFYKRNKKYDYRYSDAWHETREVRGYFKHTVEKTGNNHAPKPTRNLVTPSGHCDEMLSEEEVAYLLSLIDDDDIII